MHTFVRPAKRADRASVIDVDLPALDRIEVAFRKGEVTMIAAAPGHGKSSLALRIALSAKVPTLYLCADTNRDTMEVRIKAMLSGQLQQQIESRMDSDPDYLQQEMAQTSHIWWCWDGAPTLETLDEEVSAFEEVMGETPSMIIVDNLTDITSGEDEWAGLRSTMKSLKRMSYDLDTAVVVLHHTSQATNYNVCPPSGAIQGKVAQLPSVILTLANDPTTMTLKVSPVKNRHGMADESGTNHTVMRFDAPRMQLTEMVL